MGRDHWVETTIGDCCQINPRHKVNDDSLEVSFVTMSDISQNIPLFKSEHVRSFGEVKKGFTHFAENDVLFAKITPCMENGKSAVAINLRNGLGCGTTELHVIRSLCGVESTFLYHFIHQPLFRAEAEQRFTGSAGQRRVPLDFLFEYPFFLPPLNEQKRIIEKLDTILPKVKNAKARLEKISAILKKFRQSILSAACSGRLTEDWREGKNLAEWEEVSLKSVLEELSYGTAKKCDYLVRAGIPVLRIPNVSSGKLDLSDLKYACFEIKELQKLSLRKNDVLIIRSNGSVSLLGSSVLIDETAIGFAYAGYLIRLRCNENRLSPKYLNFTLKTDDLRSQIELPARSTTGVHNLNSLEIKSLKIPLPLLNEQQEIVRRVEKLFALADSIEAKYKKAVERVEKIEQSVLAKAFRGELAEPDPNDEPAEELLRRILEEKAKLDGGRKTKSRRVSKRGIVVV